VRRSDSEMKLQIRTWLKGKLEKDQIPHNVIALNFGMQKVFDGIELYQAGHNTYNADHTTWMIENVYFPEDNFFNLGQASLDFSLVELYELYKNEVSILVHQKMELPKNLKYITITGHSGYPELITAIENQC
jgi:hypothetical protein